MNYFKFWIPYIRSWSTSSDYSAK